MADEGKLAHAQTTFATLCQVLDDHEWHYEKDENALSIKCGAQGEDLPIHITITVDADRQFVLLLSRLPFVISEDKRRDIAVAVSFVNNELVDGSFDYDIRSGNMFFRMTKSFLESRLGKDAFTYMLFCSAQTIDEYNDKFLMLSKGYMSLEQFRGLI